MTKIIFLQPRDTPVNTPPSAQLNSYEIASKIDRQIADALERSRPSGELSAKSTTLAIVSGALFAVSFFIGATVEVELIGMKFAALEWGLVVALMTVVVVFLAMQLVLHWWIENNLWKLSVGPALNDSLDGLIKLYNLHDIGASDWLLKKIPAQMRANAAEIPVMERFIAFLPEKKSASPTLVQETLQRAIDSVYLDIQNEGSFQYIDQASWRAYMAVFLDYEVAMARIRNVGDDVLGLQESAARDAKFDGVEANPIKMLPDNTEQELAHNKKVMKYCLGASKRLIHLKRIGQFQLKSALIAPLFLAIAALCGLGFQLYARNPGLRVW